MSLIETAEQRELRSMLRRYLSGSATDFARELDHGGAAAFDAAAWRTMSDDLGIVGAAVPKDAGGDGGALQDVVIILEELGRSLDSSPFLVSAVRAAGLLVASGDGSARELIELLAAGREVATCVSGPENGAAISARRVGDTWSLSGRAARVVHAASSDVMVVLADTPEGAGLFVVRSDLASIEPQPVADPTTPLAAVALAGVPGVPVGAIGGAAEYLEKSAPRWLVAVAAYQLGNATVAFETATDHARNRHQFGRAIGSFQAVKHQLVDVMMAVESARAAVMHAADVVNRDDPSAALLAHHCMAVAAEANMLAAKACIQVLGAMGFTWEHPAHLYLKRALSMRLLYGSPDAHREQVATRLLSGVRAKGMDL